MHHASTTVTELVAMVKQWNSNGRMHLLWKEFFKDPRLWFDNRHTKYQSISPDFRHKSANYSLWIHGWSNPPWVLKELRRRAITMSGELSFTRYVKNGEEIASERDVEFVESLKACAKKKDLYAGKSLHDEVLKQGFLEKSPYIAATFIHMYVKCGVLLKAEQVLEEMHDRDVVCWNALIAGHANHGRQQFYEALSCFERMQQEGISPDAVTFTCILKACGSMRAIDKGKQIHDEIVSRGLLEKNIVLGNALVDMYAKCGMLVNAWKVLNELPVRNVVSWSALIAGHAQEGQGHEAFDCFEQMQREGLSPDEFTFTSILQACGNTRMAEKGEKIHNEIVKKGFLKTNPVLGSALVDMYAKCGLISKAELVLEKLPVRTTVSWSALIAGYVEIGQYRSALNCFERMQKEEGLSADGVIFTSILKACGNIQDIQKGKEIHDEIVERCLLWKNIVLGNALVDMYAKCGELRKAHQTLEEFSDRDVATWSTLIAGYAEEGRGHEALECFEHMQREDLSPNKVTFISILKACGSIGAIDKGKIIHNEIISMGLLKRNIELNNALVDMYAKCGHLAKAQGVLETLPIRNVVTWSALIAGYVKQGSCKQALECFERMQMEGIMPDGVTFTCMLKACSSIGIIDKGQQIHHEIVKNGYLDKSPVLGTALVDMYAKCGMLEKAQDVLEELPVRNVVSWSALIGGYSQARQGDVVLRCIAQMQNEGLSPNEITFLSVLNACNQAGKLDEAQIYYEDMSRKYGIRPKLEHHTSMAVLFGCIGCLDKAISVVTAMPFSGDPSIWVALLGACRKWGNVKLGRFSFDQVIHIDNKLAAAYFLMADIYAVVGMKEDAEKIEAMRTSIGVDMCGKVNNFEWDNACELKNNAL